MKVRDLITKLLDAPMDADVFIDLNDDINQENGQEITHVEIKKNYQQRPFVVLDADWGKR